MADGSKVLAVEVREVYGVKKAYPANELAADFAALVGCKTLPAWALKKIKGMGFKVEASNVPEEMLAGVA